MTRELSHQRIVAGVHSSPAAAPVLQWAAREAQLRHARLEAVCAWENHRKRIAHYARRAAPHPDAARLMAGAALEELVRATLGTQPPVPVTMEVTEGLAARVLLERAAGAQLLVIGTGGGSPSQVGPVARACLSHAPCPVVVVSAEMMGALAPA